MGTAGVTRKRFLSFQSNLLILLHWLRPCHLLLLSSFRLASVAADFARGIYLSTRALLRHIFPSFFDPCSALVIIHQLPRPALVKQQARRHRSSIIAFLSVLSWSVLSGCVADYCCCGESKNCRRKPPIIDTDLLPAAACRSIRVFCFCRHADDFEQLVPR